MRCRSKSPHIPKKSRYRHIGVHIWMSVTWFFWEMFHFPQYFPHRLRDKKGKLAGVLYCLWKLCLVFGYHGHNSQVRVATLTGRTRPFWNTHSCRWRRNCLNASNGRRTTGRGASQPSACRRNSPNCIAQSTPPMWAFSTDPSSDKSPTRPMDLQDILTVKWRLNGICIIWRVMSFPCFRWIFTSIKMLALCSVPLFDCPATARKSLLRDRCSKAKVFWTLLFWMVHFSS